MKAQITRALGVLLCGMPACSSGSPPDDGSQHELKSAVATTAQAVSVGSEPVDFSRPISVNVSAQARCAIYPSGAKGDASRTDFVAAGADGIVRFYPPPSTWGTKVMLDCDSAGTKNPKLVDLNDSSTYFTESALLGGASEKVVGERPALTGDLLKPSQAELLQQQYPPRPDPSTMPTQYAKWVERVSKPYQILATVPFVLAPGRHGDPFLGHFTQTIANPQAGASWSGQILNPNRAGATIYNQYEVAMLIPQSTCGGQACSSDIWGGVGGWNEPANSAFIQSGLWLQGEFCPQDPPTCPANSRSPSLNIEYFPQGVQLAPFSALNFSQGDTIFALGWSCDAKGNVTTAGAFGCYWFENYTTQKLSGIGQLPIPGMPAFPPQTFNGKTAEWIVEKPNNNAMVDYSWEEMQGVAWDQNNTSHTDFTDPWQFLDIKNTAGNNVSTSYFPANANNADQPTQSVVGFSWWNYR